MPEKRIFINVMIMKIVITGRPGTGKTTLIKEINKYLRKSGVKTIGFYTEEIREGGERLGFKIRSLDGKEGILAHRSFVTPKRVGKYGVNIEILEEIVREYMPPIKDVVYIIDEIGKMELFSSLFKDFIKSIVEGNYLFIATATISKIPFVDWIKSNPHVQLLELTKLNRKELLTFIINKIEKEGILDKRRYIHGRDGKKTDS